MKKTCTKCEKEKELIEFYGSKDSKDGLQYRCILCQKELRKEHYVNNKVKEKLYYSINKERIKERTITWIKNNKDKVEKYRNNNKDKIKKRDKEYYNKNKEKLNKISRDYAKKNKEKISERNKLNRRKRRLYEKNKKENNPIFKLKSTIRTRIYSAFKSKSWHKQGSNEKLLGCSFEIAHAHLERQFIKDMTWNNHGEWHIDHIIPLASANTEEELRKLCHYTNLQPLWAKDNLEKNNTIPEVQMKLRI
jgi:hypothetical protein